MRFLIQKVKDLKICQNKNLILEVNDVFCFLIYVGVEKGDDKKNLEEIVKKLENLQIVDLEGRFTQTLKTTKQKIIFVSQITLVANFEKGRINFNQSLDFNLAQKIFENIVSIFQKFGYNVFRTDFGSYLEIRATNIGPVNFYLNF